jgi:hypothetical protein
MGSWRGWFWSRERANEVLQTNIQVGAIPREKYLVN